MLFCPKEGQSLVFLCLPYDCHYLFIEQQLQVLKRYSLKNKKQELQHQKLPSLFGEGLGLGRFTTLNCDALLSVFKLYLIISAT